MKTNHTNGPWQLDLTKEQIIKINQHGVEFRVADLTDCINPGNDAALIAAAPEMFDALVELTEIVRRFGGLPVDNPFKYDMLIKKAKGE